MRKLIILFLLTVVMVPLRAQQKFPTIEKLVYEGFYNWGFIWVKAGEVVFTETKSDKYPRATKLHAVGSSLPSWDWIFRLRDTLTSHFDSRTYLPYEFSRKAHEGNYHKTFDYKWDYRDSIIYGDIHRIGRYKKRDTVRLKPQVYDMLSVAWKARELDFDSYKVKQVVPINILLDSEIFSLYVRYLGTDKVKIGGKRYEAYVFSPLLVEGEVFKKGENMKIWVSKDHYRLPLMVEAKILVGSVKGILVPSLSNY